MKMSRSFMGHLLHGVAVLQCGTGAPTAQTFLRIVLVLRLGVSTDQGAEQPGAGVGPDEISAAVRAACTARWPRRGVRGRAARRWGTAWLVRRARNYRRPRA